MFRTFGFAVLFFLISGLWFQAHAYAACSGPAGDPGDILYNSDYSVYQWCDGSQWIGFPKPFAGSQISVNVGNSTYGTTCAIKSDGSAYCWGEGSAGEIGDGNQTDVSTPTAIDVSGSIPDTWKEIGVGSDVTCGLAGDGTVWCWGWCGNDICGSYSNNQISPVQATTDTFETFSMRGQTACGIKADQTLWCWGENNDGNIGNGNTTDQTLPVQVSGTWKAVSTAQRHTCAIKTDGTAWCWGRNWQGEVTGDGGSTQYEATPTAVDTTGAVPDTWTAISVGQFYTCAIASDGTAWCWGRGTSGVLGDGTDEPDPNPSYAVTAVSGGGTWKAISAGGSATCGIKSDDSLWCWGIHTDGQLGDGITFGSALTPVAVSGSYSWASVTVSPGQGDDLPAQVCGIQTDGTAWCWGTGTTGERGDNSTTTAQSTPVQVSGGGTWGWGSGAECSSGEAGEIVNNADYAVLQWCDGANWIGLAKPYDITSGLVAHLKLDDSSGTTATDSSGNGNDGDLINGPVWEPSSGRIGGDLDFDAASNTEVDIDPPINFGTGDFTYSLWVKTTQDCTGDIGYLGQVDPSGSWAPNNWLGCIDGTNAAGWRIEDSTVAGEVAADGTTAINDGQWHHLVGVKEGQNPGTITLYVDGTEENTTATAFTGNFDTTNPTGIGYYGTGYHADADIDDVRIYNRALSAGNVEALHAAGNGAGCLNPAGDPGDILYNSDNSVMQWCGGATWIGFRKPCYLMPVGTVCSDGTVYAGLSPDGNVAMYTTAADEGALEWNNGNSSGYTTTSQTNLTTGETNTTNLLTIDSDSGVGGTQPHLAAQWCANSTANGHSDWYLPAEDELNVLYTNNPAIGGFDTSGSWYWSSTEFNNIAALIQRFSDGTQNASAKYGIHLLRCVRR